MLVENSFSKSCSNYGWFKCYLFWLAKTWSRKLDQSRGSVMLSRLFKSFTLGYDDLLVDFIYWNLIPRLDITGTNDKNLLYRCCFPRCPWKIHPADINSCCCALHVLPFDNPATSRCPGPISVPQPPLDAKATSRCHSHLSMPQPTFDAPATYRCCIFWLVH